ncbi:hypothetical protein B0H14DRAFT_3867311 [Mycena olivaceomarginata]|nr:hypothetical protein B0H14DRAFT_3867311 [Mycena olivaceomarginata]
MNPFLMRPWASAYLSHVRALAPIWRAPTTTNTPPYSARWAGFLTNPSFAAQSLFPPEEFLASLEAEASSNKPNAEVVLQAMKPCPPSESAAIQFLSSLSIIHTILSHLLTRADAALAALTATTNPPDAIAPFVIDNSASEASIVRGCAYGIVMGFAGLALPLYRELQQRVGVDSGDRNDLAAYARNERMRLLVAQAHQIAGFGVCELARAIRYLEAMHFVPVQRRTLCDYARFALDEAEAATVVEPECMRDIKTILDQLQISGYSQDLFSVPETASLVERLNRYLEAVNAPPVNVQIRPGETLAHFNKRIETDMRPLMRSAVQSSLAAVSAQHKKGAAPSESSPPSKSAPTTNSKSNNGHSKSNPKSSSAADADPKPAPPPIDKHASRPKEFARTSSAAPRRLNDVAQAPPELSSFAREKSSTNAPAGKAGGKSTKASILSPAQQLAMAAAREDAVQRYRALKASRRAAGGGDGGERGGGAVGEGEGDE